MGDENPNSNQPKSFAVVLANLEDGAFNDQLSREVQGLIADMSDHAAVYGGSSRGKISLSIDLVLDKGVFEISAEKKITAPKERKSKSIFWADKDNNLTEENPRQKRFDFDGNNVERLGSKPATA